MPFVEGAQSTTPESRYYSRGGGSGGGGKTLISNDPVRHPPPTPWSGRLTRGYVAREDEAHIYRLHFWLNPSKLDASYTGSMSTLGPSQMLGTNNGEYFGDKVSFSFELLFDRTEDILDGRVPEGCLRDVNVLEQLMGMQVNRFGPRGVPRSYAGDPYLFIFGGREDSETSLLYKGYITNAGITYSSFMHDMVPKRLAMSLQCELRNYDVFSNPDLGSPEWEEAEARKRQYAKETYGGSGGGAPVASGGRHGWVVP